VRRAQSLTLVVDGQGRWVIASADPHDPETVGSGRLGRSSPSGLRVTISPLGACWIDGTAEASGQPVVDPVRCRLTGALGS
jgi:hypothetical protein